MKKAITVLCVVWIFLLGGCSCGVSRGGVNNRVVTAVRVTCQMPDEWLRKEYTTPEKVRLLLLVLRTLGPDFPARVDVENLTGKTIVLSMECADGSTTVYRIRNNQYLQKNDGNWRQISEEKAGGFWQMILEMPSDEASGMVWDPFPITHAKQIYLPALRRTGGK